MHVCSNVSEKKNPPRLQWQRRKCNSKTRPEQFDILGSSYILFFGSGDLDWCSTGNQRTLVVMNEQFCNYPYYFVIYFTAHILCTFTLFVSRQRRRGLDCRSRGYWTSDMLWGEERGTLRSRRRLRRPGHIDSRLGHRWARPLQDPLVLHHHWEWYDMRRWPPNLIYWKGSRAQQSH